jgi:hypothetical protein
MEFPKIGEKKNIARMDVFEHSSHTFAQNKGQLEALRKWGKRSLKLPRRLGTDCQAPCPVSYQYGA